MTSSHSFPTPSPTPNIALTPSSAPQCSSPSSPSSSSPPPQPQQTHQQHTSTSAPTHPSPALHPAQTSGSKYPNAVRHPTPSLPITIPHPPYSRPPDPIPPAFSNKVSSAGPDEGTFCTLYSEANCEGEALPFTYPGIRSLGRYGFDDEVESVRCDFITGCKSHP